MKKTALYLLLATFLLGGCGTTTVAPPTASNSQIESEAEQASTPDSTQSQTQTESPLQTIEGFTEAESESLRQELRERIVYRTSDLGPIEIWVDEANVETAKYLGTIYLPKDAQFDSLDVESNIQGLQMDGQPWLAVTAKATINVDGVSSLYEDNYLEIMVSVNRNADDTLTVEHFHSYPYASQASDLEAIYIQNGHIGKQLNLIQADVTHDGIDDFIETYIYFFPETDFSIDPDTLIQRQLQMDAAFVKVYDGSKVTPDNLVHPIWIEQYSASHAGNGQLSLVFKDGRSYLLGTLLWQGQGAFDYDYEIFALDNEGHRFAIEQSSISFEEDDGTFEAHAALVESFKAKLAPWLENGQLIIATDVSLEEQLITTESKTYAPADYYDLIWSQWK